MSREKEVLLKGYKNHSRGKNRRFLSKKENVSKISLNQKHVEKLIFWKKVLLINTFGL